MGSLDLRVCAVEGFGSYCILPLVKAPHTCGLEAYIFTLNIRLFVLLPLILE